jgi:hypothetical protein
VDAVICRADPAFDPFFRRAATSSRLDDPALEILRHAGFKRILFHFDADGAKRLLSLSATVEIYHVDDPDTMEDPFKIGSVSYSGRLVTGGSAHGDPVWSAVLTSSCPYNESNAKKLPDLVREFGPGAFITAVAQMLFGTVQGKRLMGLEEYEIPGQK